MEMLIYSLGREDHLEEGIATHSSILAWRISQTEEPSGLQSMGSHTESDTTDGPVLAFHGGVREGM